LAVVSSQTTSIQRRTKAPHNIYSVCQSTADGVPLSDVAVITANTPFDPSDPLTTVTPSSGDIVWGNGIPVLWQSTDTVILNLFGLTPSALPSYTGQALLTGTCAIPEFTLLFGAQNTIIFYAAVIGCLDDKPECCPFSVSTPTPTTAGSAGTTTPPSPESTTTTVAGTPGQAAPTSPPSTSLPNGFPTPASQAQATLTRCPKDYYTISSVCCPS